MTTEEAEAEAKRLTFVVQRAISYAVIGVFASLMVQMAAKIIWFDGPGDANKDTVELMKQGWNLLQNLMMGVAGYWIGSAKSADVGRAEQAKVTEKMTDKVIANGTVTTPKSWWLKLNSEETAAIIAAGDLAGGNDAQVRDFITAAKASRGTVAQLEYLVTKGLLTQERATAIQAA